MKIYVASSWRNLLQPGIVLALRRCGHEVYDFRNPAPGDTSEEQLASTLGHKAKVGGAHRGGVVSREVPDRPVAASGGRHHG